MATTKEQTAELERRVKDAEQALENRRDLVESLNNEKTQLETRVNGLKKLNEDLADQLQSARSQLDVAKQLQKWAEDRMNELRTGGRTVSGPEAALMFIIGEFQAVAEGGPATALRLAVHENAQKLTLEQRMRLREYVIRLRAAAEAAEQETALILS